MYKQAGWTAAITRSLSKIPLLGRLTKLTPYGRDVAEAGSRWASAGKPGRFGKFFDNPEVKQALKTNRTNRTANAISDLGVMRNSNKKLLIGGALGAGGLGLLTMNKNNQQDPNDFYRA